jgi:hypothetical protein
MTIPIITTMRIRGIVRLRCTVAAGGCIRSMEVAHPGKISIGVEVSFAP